MTITSHLRPRTTTRVSARSLTLVAGLMVLGSGCAVHRVASRPALPIPTPAGYAGPGAHRMGPSAPATGREVERWWLDLQDWELARLVDSVLAANLDLRSAWARARQAQAAARGAGAARFPRVSLAAQTTDNSVSALDSGFPTQNTSTRALTATVAWELDLWGKASHRQQAASLDAAAARAEAEAIALAMAARTATAWYGMVQQRALADLLAEQERTNDRLLEVVRLRFGQGQARAADVLQQQQQLAATRTQLPLIEARRSLFENQLAVLTGHEPGFEVGILRRLPRLPPLPRMGVPADLLVRRPDLSAARDRIVAADHRVGVAIADRLPTLRLSFATGFCAATLADLFTGWLTNLVGGLSGDLFDGGQRRAEVDRNRAVVAQRLAEFGSAFLGALREVDDALVNERAQLETIARLKTQLAIAQQTLDTAQASFSAGIGDYLQVLMALQSLQRTEQSLIGSRGQRITARIQLYQALGGTWTRSLGRVPRPRASRPRAPTGSASRPPALATRGAVAAPARKEITP